MTVLFRQLQIAIPEFFRQSKALDLADLAEHTWGFLSKLSKENLGKKILDPTRKRSRVTKNEYH